MRYIELFCGIGGFRVGLDALGMQCVFANDINKHACAVYRKNYGDSELKEGDITQIKSEDIPEFDLLTGGFPCQSWSHAGSGRGFEDARGTLFFEVLRIIKDKHPKAILLENVKGLLTHDNGCTIQYIVKAIRELGYLCDVVLLDSSEFNVPQRRQRVYIVGIKDDYMPMIANPHSRENLCQKLDRKLGLDVIVPAHSMSSTNLTSVKPNEKYVVPKRLETELRKRLSLFPNKMFRVRDNRVGPHAIPSWTVELFGHVSREQKLILEKMRKVTQQFVWDLIGKKRTSLDTTIARLTPAEVGGSSEQLNELCNKGYIRKTDDGRFSLINRNVLPNRIPSTYAGPLAVAPTLTASNLTQFGLVLDDGIYQLSPEDLEIVQGFPNGHTLGQSKKERIRLLGNAVVPNVIQWLGQVIVRAME